MNLQDIQRKTEILNAINNHLKDKCDKLIGEVEDMRKRVATIKAKLREVCEVLAPMYGLPTDEFAKLVAWATEQQMDVRAFNDYVRNMVATHEVQGSNTKYCDRASVASEGSSSNVEAQSE